MASYINKREAIRRTGLELISDTELYFYNRISGNLENVRETQRNMEKKYPTHRLIRLAAINYFLSKGYDIYRYGITVFGVGTCPDFAIFKKNQIIFVECLTLAWTEGPDIRKKRRVEKYAPLIFAVDDASSAEFDSSNEKIHYSKRIRRIAEKNSVYWFNSNNGKLRKCRVTRKNRI